MPRASAAFAFVIFIISVIVLRALPARATPSFAYDRTASTAIRLGALTRDAGIESRELSFDAGGARVTATLVRPRDGARHAGILFVHWLGDRATTNRREFLPDARTLAQRGATSLAIDAMWARPDWFDRRAPRDDYAASIAQVIALRRALDVLEAQPDVDRSRIAYVGHDFGALYGALLAGADARPRSYVFMTPAATLWEWYLLGERPADVYAYIAQMRALDPAPALRRATMRGTLLQFAMGDVYVPASAAAAFAAAVPARDRTVRRYRAGHDLGVPAARRDRLAWLTAHLALHPAR